VHSISEKDFIAGKFDNQKDAMGPVFDSDIKQSSIFSGGSENFKMLSYKKKLIICNKQEYGDE